MSVRARWLLAAVIGYHLLRLIVWQSQNSLPVGLDEMDVGGNAVRWIAHLDKIHDLHSAWKHFFVTDGKHSPLFYWLTLIASHIVGPGWRAMYVVTGGAFLLLLFGVFFLGRQVVDERTGILAAFIVGCYPVVFAFAHTANTTMVAVAFEVWAIAFMIRSHFLAKPLPTFAAAMCLSLALLGERGAPIIVLSAPIAIMTAASLYDIAAKRNRLILRLGLLLFFVSIPVVVAGPYLWHYLTLHWSYNIRNATKDVFQLGKFWLYPQYPWLYYLVELPRQQIGGLFTAALALSMIPFARRNTLGTAMLLAMFFVPLVVFSWITTRSISFNFGMLPPAAVITACGVSVLKGKRVRRFVLAGIVIVGLISGEVAGMEGKQGPIVAIQRYDALRYSFVTTSGSIYGMPIRGVPMRETARTMAQLIPPGQFLFVIQPADWSENEMLALTTQVAAERPDARVLLLDSLPGSAPEIAALTTKGPLPEETAAEIKAITDYPYFNLRGAQMPAVVRTLLENSRVETIDRQQWLQKTVILGIMEVGGVAANDAIPTESHWQ